jgi:hypothetical protein
MRLLDWFDKGSRERDAADERRLVDRTVVFQSFCLCETAFFATWFAIVASDKQSIVDNDNGLHHAAAATLQAARLGFSGAVNWRTIAPAAVIAASAATTAALVYAGAPTPGSPEKQGVNAVSAAIGVADLHILAAELAAEIAALHTGFSTNSDVAVSFAEASRLLSLPLWPREMPVEFERTWLGVRQKLLGLDAGFDVWIAWYENRLQGVPLEMAVEERWTKISKAWFDIDPVHANAHLRSLAEGGAAKEPAPALVAAARRKKDAREQRKRWRRRIPSVLAVMLWKSEIWRDAVHAALSPGSLLALPFATYAVVSFLMRHLDITLQVPILVFALDFYTQVREWLFSFTALHPGYVGWSVPGWLKDLLKDLSFVYFYVGGATYWVLTTYFAPGRHANRRFDLLRRCRRFVALLRARLVWPRRFDLLRCGRRLVSLVWARLVRLVALLWARLVWPWHFLGFYMGWKDPLRVYANIDPDIYSLLQASRDGDGSQPVSDDVARGLDDMAKGFVYARFIPFFVVYLLLVALSASLVLICNTALGR